MKRVVVTGLGMVSPLACGVEPTWKRLVEGDAAAARVETFEVSDLPCKIAAQVPREGVDGFRPDEWMEPKEQRRVDDFIIYAMSAATQALRDADWAPKTYEDQAATGVLIGSGIGGLQGIAETAVTLHEKGPRRVSPFFIPGSLINLASGHVSIRHGLKGPNHSVVTACSTGAHAIGDAARFIALGDADVMVAGGAESAVNRLALAGFAACKALSTGFNDRPKQGVAALRSRPRRLRDGRRRGLRRAGDRWSTPSARGARIYAELIGYGLSGDAYHITAPSPEGDGAFRAMQAALKRAGLTPHDIDYVNAHGTSTPLGDEIELRAVERLVGNAAAKISMSSTKSAIGHLLGAAGAVEAIFSILAIRDGVAPPTLNLDNPSVETALDLVPHVAKRRRIDVALSNSFGFGGTNASLIFRRAD